MSLRTFGALAYRELYLSKKKMIPILIGFLVFSVLAALAILSFDYGNIGMLIANITKAAGGTALPEAELAGIKEIVVLVAKCYPILFAGFSVVSFLESCVYDEKGKWNHFYKSTPVTPVTKSAVTYLVVIGFNVVSLIVGMLFCFFIGLISGIPASSVDLGLMLTGIAAGNLLGMLLQIGIKLFHSLDKAGIMLVLIVMAVYLAFQINSVKDSMGKPPESVTSGSLIDMEILRDFTDKALIIAPIVIIASAIVGFAANVMIYKRGEK